MKITDIETIPIHPKLAERYDNRVGRARMGDIDCRMVFKVVTDVGVVGYGDYDWPGPPPPRSMVEPLIGRSPFDFMLADLNLGLGSALYDAMGKYLEVPVYKLLGQKVRDAGAVAAWTRPCTAEVFGFEVDEAMLRKAASDVPIEETRPRVIGLLRLPNGRVVHTPRRAAPQRITGMEEGAIRGIDFEWWEDDGSAEFEEAYQRMKAEAEARGQQVVD